MLIQDKDSEKGIIGISLKFNVHTKHYRSNLSEQF